MFKGHPKGLIAAALSNMGERFGYYIMVAVLTLFLCSQFGLSDGTAATIYSVFLAGIYVLSLVGGIIADKTQNYKGTIITGLIVMALGYVIIAVPINANADNKMFLLVVTCIALAIIAFGNGLFKGNLQAIVGQMYDNLEKEAAKESPEALKKAQGLRDAGFQWFYVFINIGAVFAPLVAPWLRDMSLKAQGLVFNANLPKLCHEYLVSGDAMANFDNLNALAAEVTANGYTISDMTTFCNDYLQFYNNGIHYAFIASVVAMIISLLIFLFNKIKFPTPGKKVESAGAVTISDEEKKAMATDIRQRIYALFAVLGIVIFFWFSFHQNGVSLSYFARDFVNTSTIAPEILQSINPFCVIFLTPVIMLIFSALANRGHAISTPRKIAIGMAIAGIAYLFLMVVSMVQGYPSSNEFLAQDAAAQSSAKIGVWVMIVMYFILTVAELFISPLGLSFVSKVAPSHMQGLCQGLWLAATAVGNLLLPIGPLMYNNWPIWQCWLVFAIVCIVSMVVMLGMVKWLERVAK